jgi:hypothetical protein|tara:strand:- start:87 stop:353 length:267 start_codon:yes stop_codon:yes gene_type:complete
MTPTDMAHLRRGENISLQQHEIFQEEENIIIPNKLLHGGEHFDDVGANEILREVYCMSMKNRIASLPRDLLKEMVTNQGLVRPTPKNW